VHYTVRFSNIYGNFSLLKQTMGFGAKWLAISAIGTLLFYPTANEAAAIVIRTLAVVAGTTVGFESIQ
jgi:hypothetical protein